MGILTKLGFPPNSHLPVHTDFLSAGDLGGCVTIVDVAILVHNERVMDLTAEWSRAHGLESKPRPIIARAEIWVDGWRSADVIDVHSFSPPFWFRF